MDPYLEAPDIWPDVHAALANIIREQLTPLVAPNYTAELGTQIVIERIVEERRGLGAVPDVTVARAVSETATAVAPLAPMPVRARIRVDMPVELVTVYIRKREGQRIVAAVEVLSPVNKRPGKGRDEYLEKRAGYMSSGIHLIEIDLLRKWPRMPVEGDVPEADYRVVVRNAYEGEECSVWPVGVRQLLPVVPVPLLRPDPDVPLDLGAALRTAYERARYDLRLNYNAPADPPLASEDAAWAASLIQAPAASPA
jgi:hypothetical protein